MYSTTGRNDNILCHPVRQLLPTVGETTVRNQQNRDINSSAECQSIEKWNNGGDNDGEKRDSQTDGRVALVAIITAKHLILIGPDEESIIAVGRTAAVDHILQPIHHCHTFLTQTMYALHSCVNHSTISYHITT